MTEVMLEETINITRTHYLLDTYTLDQHFLNFTGTKADCSKDYAKIIKYLNSKVSSSNSWIKYHYSKGRHSGRLYGVDSIQYLMRNLRSFLCQGITTDIDIVNCHPTILLKICELNGILAPVLKLYVSDRQKCIEQIQAADNCSYSKAKHDVLTTINMERSIKTKSPFLQKFDKEIKEIHIELQGIQQYDYIKQYAKSQNFNGSFISHLLQINENIVLKYMREYCDINELGIHSLMFDGMQVYGDVKPNFLDGMEAYIHKKSDFDNIKLIIKEHETDIEMPADYEPKKRITYADIKSQFELTNCQVRHQFVSCHIGDVSIYGICDFRTLHMAMKFIDDTGKERKFIEKWYDDENKKRYERFDCIPKASLCPEDTFNLWVPFPVEKMPPIEPNNKTIKALHWFLNHIKVVLADNNEEHYQFIMLWLSQMIQYPENKSTHLIFVGEEGCGKGTFVAFFQTMFGSNKCFQTADPQEDIFGKFNDQMKDAFLVVLNEADKSGTYNSNSKLKDLITDQTINIRPKGKTCFNMKSCHRFLSFSNNPDPSIKNKRRDFTFRMNDSKVANTEYFNEGYVYASSIECCKVIYDYLMNWASKPHLTINDFPEGDFNMITMEEQRDTIIEFIEELVYLNLATIVPKDYSADNLYSIFVDYCKRTHQTFVKTKIAFCMKIMFMKLDGISKKVKWLQGKAVKVYTFDFALLKYDKKLKILTDLEEMKLDYGSDDMGD